MKILDEWDSQFLYLSKGHFTSYFQGELEKESMLIAKHIWKDRCGLCIQHVKTNSINVHLISMCHYLGIFERYENIAEFALDCSPFNRYGFNPKVIENFTQKDFALNAFQACMSKLSLVQVSGILDDDRRITLVSITEKQNKYKLQNLEMENNSE